MNFGLTDLTIQLITSVFLKHSEIEEVVIYGSRAKGNYREGSDIDLTLIGQGLSSDLLSTILQEIDDLNTPYLFDISIFSSLNHLFLVK
jgi:predicted nucleotidyltransferase